MAPVNMKKEYMIDNNTGKRVIWEFDSVPTKDKPLPVPANGYYWEKNHDTWGEIEFFQFRWVPVN